MGFAVYFNAKELNDTLYTAVKVYEGLDEFPGIVEENDASDGATFYENELDAFLMALEVIKDEGFDEVVLYNQHRLLFQWLGKERHDNTLRNYYYKEIKKIMGELVNSGVNIGYKVIKGDKNEAKKYLKKYIDSETSGVNDLTSMFKSSKVVKFNRKAN